MPQKIAHRPIETLVLLSAVLACMPDPAWADRGGIRSEPINIEEPAQRAIIAFNGVREWLILQTDVRAEKATKIVEFMPLPTKPEVSLASEGCFVALRDLIEKHSLRYTGGMGGTETAKGGAGAGELVEVVVSAQLGPHDVTVAEARSVDAFVAWVREFFRKHGLGEPLLTEELRAVVTDYLARDLRFFAFDIVTVSPEQQTVQPLAYEFRTDRLYYPLVVTNLYGGGPGTVELFVILSEGLGGRYAPSNPVPHTLFAEDSAGAGKNRQALSPKWDNRRWRYTGLPAPLTPDELAGLHPDLATCLGAPRALLWANKYEGPLHFARDLYTPLGYPEPDHVAMRFLAALAAKDADALESWIATPFALAGREIVFDREIVPRKLTALNWFKSPEDIPRSRIDAHSVIELRDEFSREFVAKYLQGNGHDFRVLHWCPSPTTDGYYVLVLRTGHGFYRVVGFGKQ